MHPILVIFDILDVFGSGLSFFPNASYIGNF